MSDWLVWTNCFLRKSPSQMFDRILNASMNTHEHCEKVSESISKMISLLGQSLDVGAFWWSKLLLTENWSIFSREFLLSASLSECNRIPYWILFFWVPLWILFNPFLPNFSVSLFCFLQFCACCRILVVDLQRKFGWMVSLSVSGKRGVWSLMGSLGLNSLQVLNFLYKDFHLIIFWVSRL